MIEILFILKYGFILIRLNIVWKDMFRKDFFIRYFKGGKIWVGKVYEGVEIKVGFEG